MAALSAQLQLAQQLEREGRRAEAAALVREAAESGDPHAQFLFGVRQLGSAANERASALEMISKAAKQGHAQALHLWAVMAAAGFGQRQDWRAALGYLAQAADRGDRRAQAQIALLGPPDAFDLAAWLTPPTPRMAFATPRVGVIDHFLPTQVCDWLMAVGRPGLKRALILDPQTGERSSVQGRTNSGAYLGLLQADVVVRLVKARIAAVLDRPVSHQEDANILHYAPGQVFDEHYDFQDPGVPGHAKEIAAVGQRVATFLIYLNQGFDGGETNFPLLEWSYKGSKGDAVFFWNVSAQGAVERQLLHAGRAPTRGEKWLFSQWVRDRPIEGVDLPSIG